MNRRIRKKNAGLYLRQGLLSIVLLVMTIYLGMTSSLKETLFPPTIKNWSEFTSDSLKKHSIVKIHNDILYYTGYDNHSGEKVTGHYYYTIQENRCFFLLLDKQNGTPKETLTDYEGIFHLTEDENLYNQLTLALAKDTDWSSSSLKKIALPIIASQPDYHSMPALVLIGAIVFCSLVFVLSAINNFYSYHRYKHHIRHHRRTNHHADRD